MDNIDIVFLDETLKLNKDDLINGISLDKYNVETLTKLINDNKSFTININNSKEYNYVVFSNQVIRLGFHKSSKDKKVTFRKGLY